MSAIRIFPSLIPPAIRHILERYLVRLSYQIDEVLLDLWLTSDNIRPLLPTKWLVLWMILHIAFHKEFSRLPGGLRHFADSSGIPLNRPTFFSSKPDCTSTPDVPSLTRRTARSAMPFVSDRWGVEVQWFHANSSHDLPNSNELSV